MKRTDQTLLFSLWVCLVLFMASYQPASYAKNFKVDIIRDVKDQVEPNFPLLEVTSSSAEADNNRVIFKGEVRLKRDHLITFFADSISIERLGDEANYVIQMKGNVTMTLGDSFIKGEEAFSLDFKTYVDFVGNVSISKYGPYYKRNRIRYYFLPGFKLDDLEPDETPIRG